MKKAIKVKDMVNGIKESSGAIINNDVVGYQKRLKQKRLNVRKQQQIETLENKVNRLEGLIERILNTKTEVKPKKKKVK